MRLAFVKMEGAGNDYVYVDGIAAPFDERRGPELAQLLSHRHFGIGADGLIVLAPSDRADLRMLMWNADGSRGAMCGNGLRCLAVLARERRHVGSDRMTVATDAGVRRIELVRRGQAITGARVDLTDATVSAAPEQIEVAGRTLAFHTGDAGNPHAVVFVAEDPEDFPVPQVGGAMQGHARFPGGVNVEFVQVQPDGGLVQRTFERGAGETLACGSGAAVAALAAVRTGRVRGPVVPVRVRGGLLLVHVGGSSLVLEGPARTVFSGEIELDDGRVPEQPAPRP